LLISRSERRPEADDWAVSLRVPLPEIVVPLRAGDPDARMYLQEVLHRADAGPGCEHLIHGGTPEPPRGGNRAWAEGILRWAGTKRED
jgi:hypothetical protein